ncbi:MAG: hypothetical protein R3B95_11885 [Nitrospirales bacterium]|nr:hypothetical protein [Nitrospirales bacterium]
MARTPLAAFFNRPLQEKEHWLQGDSPSLRRIMVAYDETMLNPKRYLPLFMILAGKTDMHPTEGFGADEEVAFVATRLVRVMPGGNCSSNGPSIDFSEIREGLGFPTRG